MQLKEMYPAIVNSPMTFLSADISANDVIIPLQDASK
jgi:hypothetical protein